ncbi:hypothetical protein CC80DRAFT_465449 [Byssothecium circinans]|uniref:F-box domain-containing protein n=1 Tax=Byssothecium circinans TaxID=147558 RepID=A0A6A5UIV6_9PLEO|nr:hypothetical protein CC80DRAFT_465449 [Byssothecium circinans]
MATATLAGMPLELLVHIIANYLPTKDLGALRLTSKYFETALFDTFAKEFFAKKQFMLTTPSLSALIEISKHTALSKVVKHVILGLEKYDRNYVRFADIASSKAHRNGWVDQVRLLSSGRAGQMISEALRNLPNVTTIGLRDYAAQGRVREDNSRWRSYGAPSAERESGVRFPHTTTAFASDAFSLLLQSLADADKIVPSIEVILRHAGVGLDDSAFYIPPGSAKLPPVLDGMKQLLLTIDMNDKALINVLPAQDWDSEPLYLESFLLRTPSLNHLRLNFQMTDQDNAHHVLERLSSANNILPVLERLDFGMMTTTPDMLLKILSTFPELRHIGLWKLNLGDQGPLLTARWRDSNNNFNPWPEILRCTSITNKQLTGMMVGCLGLNNFPISMPIQLPQDKVSKEYTGGIATWLAEASDDLMMKWPEPVVTDDSFDEDLSDSDHSNEEYDEDTEDD